MLKLPGSLTAETFLGNHWQRAPLFMPGGLDRVTPSITRNELAWLATLEDVESRIVFTDRGGGRPRYRVAGGPFEADDLAKLPKRDWTLLVHDVEKHLPVMRGLFRHVPFVPDWRIDDLMVSFAAPGGGVGPHEDNYDVFLCQGIGVREWHVTTDDIAVDARASNDLALLAEFRGSIYEAGEGDVLYLPPGVPHWGTARRACTTYSIGMRAPRLADLAEASPDDERDNPFYRDADLGVDESRPGWISPQAIERTACLLAGSAATDIDPAVRLGEFVTTTKEWLALERLPAGEAASVVQELPHRGRLALHGMARVATDGRHVFVNGRSYPLPRQGTELLTRLCATRHLPLPLPADPKARELVTWMVESGAFDIPGNL